jgi:hypothetical protein
VAKSTQHVDKLGSYDDFKAPWESEAGEDAEIVKGTLKRLIYNLKQDLAKARDAKSDAEAAVTAAETERDEAKAAASDGTGAEAQKQIDKLTKDLEKVTGERDSLQGEKDQAELRKEVLGDFEAKNPKAAKYVTGTTKEELEASLEEVKSDWGITDEPGDDEGDEDETPVVRTRPKATLSNPADPNNGKGGDAPIDFDKIADEIYSGGSVFK